MDHDTLRTGEVAALAGVNVQTLRYYERRGLLQEPQRRPSGYRDYPRETVRLIRFVKRAQELGFTLVEIAELIRLRDDEERSCPEVRAAALAKIADIDKKLESLRAMKRALGILVRSCRTDGSPRRCPILAALDREDRKERRS